MSRTPHPKGGSWAAIRQQRRRLRRNHRADLKQRRQRIGELKMLGVWPTHRTMWALEEILTEKLVYAGLPGTTAPR